MKKKPSPKCAECDHKKKDHDLGMEHFETKHCMIDGCNCDTYKSALQKAKEAPRKTKSKTTPTLSSEIAGIVGKLVGNDKKAQVRLRQILRLARKMEVIEIAARQVVAHTHAVEHFSPRDLHKFLSGKNTNFRIAVTELERSL